MKISTNLKSEISDKEIKNINDFVNDEDHIKLFEYKEKGVGLREIAKFIIQDVIISGVSWEIIKKIFICLLNIAKKNKKEGANFWIIDTEERPINIAFSATNEEEINSKINLLKETIDSDKLFSEIYEKDTSIVWVTFDEQEQEWVIKEY